MAVMPVEFKDYYAVLGVPRGASADDIKKAFRKLARQHHPDVAKDKQTAEERFKEINEAHEVLSDPEKRKRYDELGADWQNGAPHVPSPENGRHRGRARSGSPGGREDFEFHFGGTGFSDFFERFFGGASRGNTNGFSFAEEDGFEPGSFDRRNGPARGHDIEGDILVTLDEVMKGGTRQISLQRVDPRTGATTTETFKARIPAGVQDGQTIRARGLGGEGADGGARGDLYLHVRLAAHPEFRVEGADLYHELELAPWDAVLGTSLTVPTPTSRVSLRIPPGTTNQQHLRIRGHGLPKGKDGGRGDLYVVVVIDVPAHVSPGERELWEKLRQASRFNPQ